MERWLMVGEMLQMESDSRCCVGDFLHLTHLNASEKIWKHYDPSVIAKVSIEAKSSPKKVHTNKLRLWYTGSRCTKLSTQIRAILFAIVTPFHS